MRIGPGHGMLGKNANSGGSPVLPSGPLLPLALILFTCSLTLSCRTSAPMAARQVRAAVLSCPASADRDQDGLSDDCELELARRFAPWLRVAARGCNWDTSVSSERPGGGYYFGVQALGDTLRVVYLPAYYRDCGWSGFKCTIGLMNCAGHAGDSEFIALDLRRGSASQFVPEGIFLSAHCFGRSTDNCRWYRGDELDQFEWQDSHPMVWVAEGKHANYPTQQSCDAGHWFFDTCDHNDTQIEFPIVSERQNIGSRTQPVATSGCVDAQHSGWTSRLTDTQATECFWLADHAFTGWQRPAVGAATPYERYLSAIARF